MHLEDEELPHPHNVVTVIRIGTIVQQLQHAHLHSCLQRRPTLCLPWHRCGCQKMPSGCTARRRYALEMGSDIPGATSVDACTKFLLAVMAQVPQMRAAGSRPSYLLEVRRLVLNDLDSDGFSGASGRHLSALKHLPERSLTQQASDEVPARRTQHHLAAMAVR